MPMAEFLAGVIAGLAAAGLLVIVLAPSRRLRAEARLDQEVETRLLLGVDPESSSDAPPLDDATHDDFDPAEIAALRQIGTERSSNRRKGRRR